MNTDSNLNMTMDGEGAGDNNQKAKRLVVIVLVVLGCVVLSVVGCFAGVYWLGSQRPENISVEVNEPDSMELGQEGVLSITITNTGPDSFPGVGIAYSTGTAWGTSYSTSGTGTVVALSANPALTGTPTAPTATVGTNTTQIATTAFVTATSFVSALPGQAGNAGKFITTDGTNASWSYVPLTTGVSGTLPVANGGTNGTAAPTAGAIAYGTGTAYAFTAAGTAGQVLLSNGASAPAFGGVDGGTF